MQFPISFRVLVVIIGLVCLGCAFQIFTSPIERGLYQAFLIPVLALSLTPFFFKYSKLLVLLMLLGTGASVAATVRTYFFPQCTFCIALKSYDELGGKTRVLLEKIEQRASVKQGLGIILQNMASDQQASEWLEQHPGARSLLWLQNKELVVSFQPVEPVEVRPAFGNQGLVQPLRLIRSIPRISLSVDSGGHSFHFLSALIADGELERRGAARLRAPWTGASHLGFAFWHLASQLLRNSIEEDFSWGELECALRTFEQAQLRSRFSENPHLTLALANNHAVGEFLNGVFSARQSQIRQSLKLLKRGKLLAEKLEVSELSEFGTVFEDNFVAIKRFMKENGIPVKARSLGKRRSGKSHGRKGKRAKRQGKTSSHKKGSGLHNKKHRARASRQKDHRKSS